MFRLFFNLHFRLLRLSLTLSNDFTWTFLSRRALLRRVEDHVDILSLEETLHTVEQVGEHDVVEGTVVFDTLLVKRS